MYLIRMIPKRVFLLTCFILIVITKIILSNRLGFFLDGKIHSNSKTIRENQNINLHVIKDSVRNGDIEPGKANFPEKIMKLDEAENKNSEAGKDNVNDDNINFTESNAKFGEVNINAHGEIENIQPENDKIDRHELNASPGKKKVTENNDKPLNKNENIHSEIKVNPSERNKEKTVNTILPVKKENNLEEKGILPVDGEKLPEKDGKLPADNGRSPERNGKPREKRTQGKGEHKLVMVPIPKLIFGRNGRGRNGEAVKIDRSSLDPASRVMYDEGYRRNDFNEYLSNLISVDRLTPDSRDPLCDDIEYPDDLPDTSVIITFLNEAWSVLVRTIHSIIRTAPPHLLREIILVDDFSDYEYLKGTLEDYMQRFPKVKILRNSKREGLIRSRLNGARLASGQVLTFLDSHIECVAGWLPPLLARIKEDPSHVVWPNVPAIDRETFHLPIRKSAADMSVGTFTWALTYSWEKPNLSDRQSPVSPIRSPTMAGGLFSIDRNYFYHIGSYDDQMLFWGGENLEISFRIWMCGGTVEVIPCSIIAHIYRLKNVNANPQMTENIHRNLKRTAVVWMDDYSRLYAKISRQKLMNYGDVSERVALRRKLNCKSFEWYLKNVCVNAFTPSKATTYGALRSVADKSRCLHADDRANARVMANHCNLYDTTRQVFYMNDQEELRHLSYCLDANSASLTMYSCHRRKGTQQFQYRNDGTVYNPRLRLCMEVMLPGVTARLMTCDSDKKTQQWRWFPVSMDL